MSSKCMRCCSEPANPVLCNRCAEDIKAEWQKVVEEVSKYIITVEDLTEEEDTDSACPCDCCNED